MLQSPEALSLPLAIRGGQLVAHCPLHTDLPEPMASRSNVYSVMPFGPTNTPSATLAGEELGIMEAHAEIRPASARVAKRWFMGLSPCWGLHLMNAPTAGFIPRPGRHGSAVSVLHRTFHLALAFALLDAVALVV